MAAGSISGARRALSVLGRALAGRGDSRRAEGSGAPSAGHAGRRLPLAAGAALIAALAFLALAPLASADPCPNEGLREENNSLSLPECRAYEVVTSAESAGLGGDLNSSTLGDGEGRLVIQTQTLGEPVSLPAQYTPFLLERESQGWEVRQLGPPPDSIFGEPLGGYWVSPDYSVLWAKATAGEGLRGEMTFRISHPDGTITEASPLLAPLEMTGALPGSYQSKAQSRDLSTYVFELQHDSRVALKFLPDEPMLAGASNTSVYLMTDANTAAPQLSLLNRGPAGEPMVNKCGIGVAGMGTISDDGSAVYFTARPTPTTACTTSANRQRVFKRVDAASTVPVSASQCTRVSPTPCSSTDGDDKFVGASRDGSRAFFTSTRQLTNSDEDATEDLYLYDSTPPAGQPSLVQVSAGEVTPGHPEVGKGATVLGVVDMAADGSRVYFVAKGALATGAVAGANNLFVFERDAAHPSGRIKFVTALAAGDSGLWVGGTRMAWALPRTGAGDGRYFVFGTKEKLAGSDNDSSVDAYRYDDVSGQTICLSCTGEAEVPVYIGSEFGGSAGTGSLPGFAATDARVATDDVSAILLWTKAALLPEDTNGTYDVYLWTEGGVQLITGGTGAAGVSARPPARISADGTDIYFSTTAAIVPSHPNSSFNVYDARRGGGFPQPREVERCHAVETCHTAAAQAPASPGDPTSTYSGPGNQVSPPPKPCAKGKVRQRGRCVKKVKHPKKKHGKKRATHRNHSRGAK